MQVLSVAKRVSNTLKKRVNRQSQDIIAGDQAVFINGSNIVGEASRRARLYNPEVATRAMQLATENIAKNGPFDQIKFDNLIENHPLFSDLHLVAASQD